MALEANVRQIIRKIHLFIKWKAERLNRIAFYVKLLVMLDVLFCCQCKMYHVVMLFSCRHWSGIVGRETLCCLSPINSIVLYCCNLSLFDFPADFLFAVSVFCTLVYHSLIFRQITSSLLQSKLRLIFRQIKNSLRHFPSTCFHLFFQIKSSLFTQSLITQKTVYQIRVAK